MLLGPCGRNGWPCSKEGIARSQKMLLMTGEAWMSICLAAANVTAAGARTFSRWWYSSTDGGRSLLIRRRGRADHQAQADGDGGCLDPVADGELAQDIGDVDAGGLRADE